MLIRTQRIPAPHALAHSLLRSLTNNTWGFGSALKRRVHFCFLHYLEVASLLQWSSISNIAHYSVHQSTCTLAYCILLKYMADGTLGIRNPYRHWLNTCQPFNALFDLIYLVWHFTSFWNVTSESQLNWDYIGWHLILSWAILKWHLFVYNVLILAVFSWHSHEAYFKSETQHT